MAKYRKNKVIISNDADFRELVGWFGSHPKLIYVQFGNCSNSIFWDKLNEKIYDAIKELIYGDTNIFDIK